jgi:hypothetical protein
MRTFIIIMWILNVNTLEGHKQEWKGDLQTCLRAAFDYNKQHKDSYAGCYPESISPYYIPERKKEDL